MICKRCGSTNADTDRFCRRCGTKLSEDVSEGGSSTEKAVPVSKKTVRIDKSEFVSRQSGFRVHDCGYPLLPDMTVCPNCKLPVGGAVPPEEQPPAPKPAEPVSKKTEVISLKSSKATTVISKAALAAEKASSSSPSAGKAAPAKSEPEPQVVDKRTINPYIKKKKAAKPEPPAYHCSLLPFVRDDEGVKLDKNVYESQTVILNRQNTDPSNPSITSKQQARLTCEDGVWYVEDLSSQQTTFIRVSRKTALQDGDVILLGDREFEFSTQ